MAAAGGGGFANVGYSMTADETAYWQDMAALLDPAAYEFVYGSAQTRTVPGDEHWYLVGGWWLQTSGSNGQHWEHRGGGILEAMPLPPGLVLTTRSGGDGGSMYLCKPALVTTGVGHDSRYDNDPRGLFFNRMMRLANELTQYQIGNTDTGSGAGSVASANFPTDFTNGMVVHLSNHDLAWIGIFITGLGHAVANFEISDDHQVRTSVTMYIPFVRTTFPTVAWRGAGQTEGQGTITYVKLPGDW